MANSTRPHGHDARGSRAADDSATRTRRRSSAARVGRSGPRSRLGCVTCKQRRVRCDEAHPVCGHCTRLQLHCHYKPHSQRWRRQQEAPEHILGDASASLERATDSRADDVPTSRQQQPPHDPTPVFPFNSSTLSVPGFQTPSGVNSRSGNATPNPYSSGLPSWTLARTFDFNDIFSELDTSWAGELSCVLPDTTGLSAAANLAQPVAQVDGMGPIDVAVQQDVISPAQTTHNASLQGSITAARSAASALATQPQRQEPNEIPSALSPAVSRQVVKGKEDPSHLFQLFKKIHQPPAAILIGGFERWHRLQHYLCKLSDQSRAVNNSLLCVVQLLMIEDMAKDQGQSREQCMRNILDQHSLACQEVERKLSKKTPPKATTRECLLATIFLLGWFEVIRDQDSHSSLFPRQLADAVITINASWNRYSQQLLSWLNTLDSKATHLGREHLLAPASLQVVSYYHTEITSSLQQGGDFHDKDSDDSDTPSPDDSSAHSSPTDIMSTSPSLNLGQVKQAMLNTILQPALAWYLTSQSYCRRISAHDKHHRRRFNSDDEYEVVTACKQIETELFELWDYRPAVISVPAEQLMAVVSPDVATRLEEIFSTYLASFWILFVYLHRISWWHLPLSPLARRALSEVWRHMQRAYGEEVNGPLHKVIHPCLLWPLFLFGSECQNEDQRIWACEQLEALGEAKPVLPREGTDADTIPPFKLSSGATRNAHRAALLLRELIKEQDMKQGRVDDRDLSMKMFGCYFSIV